MTPERFEVLINKQMDTCMNVLVHKASEYATEDRLHNFRVAAAVEGITPRQALAGMMAKHTVSVYDMCRAGDYSLGLWAEKITDSINYLLLLWALVIDEEEEDA